MRKIAFGLVNLVATPFAILIILGVSAVIALSSETDY